MKRFLLPSVVSLIGLLAGCNTDPQSASRRFVGNGNKYFEKGKYKQASIMYRRALQKDARNGDAWFGLGQTNVAEGSFFEALKDFQRASDLDGPHKLEAAARVGDLDFTFFTANPQHKELLDELKLVKDTLLKADKNSYDGWRLSGYYDLTQKDLKSAVADLQRANASKPHQPEVITMLVQALLAKNQPVEAEKLAQVEIEKNKK